MNEIKQKLTLDRQVNYQIKVPGHLNKRWVEEAEGITVAIGCDKSGLPITTLTGAFDQAALLSLLRRLYSLGLPLISAIWVDFI